MSHLPLFSQGVFEFKCILPLFYHSIWSGHIQVTAAAARQDAGNFSVPKSAETPGQSALRTKNVIGILTYVPPATQDQVEAPPLVPLGLTSQRAALLGYKRALPLLSSGRLLGSKRLSCPGHFHCRLCSPLCEFVQSQSIGQPSVCSKFTTCELLARP